MGLLNKPTFIGFVFSFLLHGILFYTLMPQTQIKKEAFITPSYTVCFKSPKKESSPTLINDTGLKKASKMSAKSTKNYIHKTNFKNFIALFKNFRAPIYPLPAKRKKLEGTVKVKFIFSKDKKFQTLYLSHSSGHSILDCAVMACSQDWVSELKTWDKKKIFFEEMEVPFIFKLNV